VGPTVKILHKWTDAAGYSAAAWARVRSDDGSAPRREAHRITAGQAGASWSSLRD